MVKRIPLHFIRQFLFWMLYFQLGRLAFVLFNLRAIMASADASDLFGIFWHSIYLDTSATCYIMAFPFVLLLLQSLLKLRLLNTVNLIYSFLVIFLIALITSSELPLYREWGIKLHYKALEYLYHPSEILRTAKNSDIIIGVLLIVIQSIFAWYLYLKFIHRRFILQQRNYAVSAAFLLITPPLIAIGLRGGLQQIPINQSDVYFSKSNVVNLAAVNSAWNLAHSIEQNKFYMDNNPYIWYPVSEAERIVSDLHRISSDSTERILRVPRPNIVLIILESWSADLVAALGGEHGITPRFDTLAKSGFLFTNCYASGDRSDQGMAALLSGFPAQ
ncbi:MAG: LTA synthase family protein, partial [Flavobacteriales bacterium]